MRSLKHIAKPRLKPKLAPFAIVSAVDEYFTLGRLIESAYEVYDGGLTCAGLAHESYVFTLPNVKIEIGQHFFALFVCK